MPIESDDIEMNRRENARMLANQIGSKAKFADAIGRSAGQVGHMIGKTPTKNIGKTLARHIEKCFGIERFWLDRRHSLEPDQTNLSTASALGQDREKTLIKESYIPYASRVAVFERLSRELSPRDKLRLAKRLLEEVQVDLE